MSESRIYELLDNLKGEIAATLHPASPVVTVRAGDSLQAALDVGGAIQLEAATWQGTYVVRSTTVLTGRAGTRIEGQTGPALVIEPGTHDVRIVDLSSQSQASEVITIGENTGRQTQVREAPRHITFTRVRIPSHRGKRGIAVHGESVTLDQCEVLDVWDPAGQDSQAVYIGNAPGRIYVSGGRYSAGSNVFLCGGDTTRIPHLTPEDITLDGVTLFRPLSWQTDGVKRKVKNLFEAKNGRGITLVDCILDGCWADGQQGEAIVLTPRELFLCQGFPASYEISG